MKKTISLLVACFLITAAGFAQTNKKAKLNTADYALFGQKFTLDKVMTEKEMLKKYKALKKGDTITVKFTSNIKSVCKKKGCWMNLDLSADQKAFVKFKDYGFFVPLNADGSDAVVSGKAYVEIVSVDELKHYAKDAGKSQAEINKIKKPEVTYAFMADGVYIKK